MEQLVEEAFRVALGAEISSYRYYRSVAVLLPDEAGKEVFRRLAAEQKKVIDEMLQYAPQASLRAMELKDPQADHAASAPSAAESGFFEHLRVALLQKNSCIDRYATFVRVFKDPALCRIFQMALRMARKQYHLIAREYRAADESSCHSGANRRTKRTHIKSVSRQAPNQHSQLFVSLLDSCRPSPFLR